MPDRTSENSRRLPAGIWALGLVSLLMDVSSEMIHSLLPVFLVVGLGAGAVTVGLIDGLGEATALFVKVFSGALSDWTGRRKPLAVLGYALGAVAKPLFVVAPAAGLVFLARFVDRIGKGMRGAPRDALVASIAPAEQRGAAFGLRQSLDTLGALLGPLIAIGLMSLWNDEFRAVFAVAVVPAVAAVVVLVLFVREPEPSTQPEAAFGNSIAATESTDDADDERPNPLSRARIALLPRSFWLVLLLGAAMSLARPGEAFLVLRGQQAGLALAFAPLVLVVMNLAYTVSSYPAGRFMDRHGPGLPLFTGLVLLALAQAFVAADGHGPLFWAGVLLWGLHLGLTQGLMAAMVAAAAPESLRGTAFGLFSLASGVALVAGGALIGLLWDGFGPGLPFALGAGASLVIALLLPRLARAADARDAG